MRNLALAGYSIPQISNATSVRENIVSDVLDGTWDAAEKAQQKEQKAVNAKRKTEKADARVQEAAAIAAATAQALQGAGVLPDNELSPQQRAANTRKANREAKLEQEEAEAEAAQAGEEPNAAA
jgi:hypothetical protein